MNIVHIQKLNLIVVLAMKKVAHNTATSPANIIFLRCTLATHLTKLAG